MIALREADGLDDLNRRIDRLDDDAVRRIIALLAPLHDQTLAALARRPDLSASDVGALKAEIETLLRDYRGRLTTELQSWQQLAFDLGDQVFDAELARAGVRVGIVGISRTTLELAQRFSADLITNLTDDARARISREVQLASLGGRSFSDLMTNIGKQLDGPGVFGTIATRAEMIARTEVNRVYSMSYYQQGQTTAAQLPGLRKTWEHATGHVAGPGWKPGMYRARPEHVALDGVTIPWSDDFHVGGELAKFPHDPRLSAAQSAGCKCRLKADVSKLKDEWLRIEPLERGA